MALLLNAGDAVSRSYSYTQPSPLHPIMPQGTGERTENLWDGVIGVDNVILDQNGRPTQNNAYALSEYIPVEPNTSYIYHFYHNIAEGNRSTYSVVEYDSNKNVIKPLTLQRITENRDYNISFTTQANSAYIRINWKKAPDKDLMLNLGSTALPYEPYGYKIPILSAGQTTPVYLDEVETTRRVKKLVLTGEENIEIKSGNAKWYIPIADMRTPPNISVIRWYCSHYQAVANNASWTSYDYMISWSTADFGSSIGLRIRDIDLSTGATVADFKAYLAQQYAAGTPVTIWYVLAEPTTGIVNEPLRKIGDYADTLSYEQAGVQIPTNRGNTVIDVMTELKPSQMYIKYQK